MENGAWLLTAAAGSLFSDQFRFGDYKNGIREALGITVVGNGGRREGVAKVNRGAPAKLLSLLRSPQCLSSDKRIWGMGGGG